MFLIPKIIFFGLNDFIIVRNIFEQLLLKSKNLLNAKDCPGIRIFFKFLIKFKN